MKLPNYINSPMVDKDGYLTSEWSNVMTQLITELQLNLSDEGYRIPHQPTANINQLTEPRFEGAIIYDESTDEMKANIDGTWRVIQVI